MKHYGFGSRILAWVCVVVMLVMMMPLSGFTAVEEEIVEESPVYEAPVVLAALDGLPATYTVSFDGGDTVTSNGAENVEDATAYEATLTVAKNYTLTEDNISVSVGGSTLQEGYSYTEGTLRIEAEYVTGNITITATAVENDNVSVAFNGGEQVTSNGADKAYVGEAYTAVLTLKDATHYTLTKSDITVVGVAEAAWDYNDGTLTIAAGEIQKDQAIAITATAVENDNVSVTFEGGEQVTSNGADKAYVGEAYTAVLTLEDAAHYTLTKGDITVVGVEETAWDYNDGTLTIAADGARAGQAITITATAVENDNVSVTFNGGEQVTSNGAAKAYVGEAYTAVLTLKDAAHYTLTKGDITVVGVEETAWDYSDGTLTIAEGGAQTGQAITIKATPTKNTYDVSISSDTLSITPTTAPALEELTLTITPVKQGDNVPATGEDVAVYIGGNELDSNVYTYTADKTETSWLEIFKTTTYPSATIKIPGDYVTGNVAVTAVAETSVYQVSVIDGDDEKLVTATVDKEKATHGVEYSAKVEAEDGYTLPASIQVKVNNVELDAREDGVAGYSWTLASDKKSADLYIDPSCVNEAVAVYVTATLDAGAYELCMVEPAEENGENNWYNTAPTIKPAYEGLEISLDGNEWKDEISVLDGNYTVSGLTVYVRAEGQEAENKNTQESLFLKVDSTAPKITDIAYSETSIGHGPHYGNAALTVTFSIQEDNFDQFSDIKVGSYTLVVTQNDKTFNNPNHKWTADDKCIVTIPANAGDGDFEIKLTVYDDAGNSTTEPADHMILDTTAPVVQASYAASPYDDGKYYSNNEIKVTFDVTDDNFDQKALDKAGSYTISATKDGVTYDGEITHEWSDKGTCVVTLNRKNYEDGKYIISLQATDEAGNISQTCQTEVIVLDTTAPEVNISGYSIDEQFGKYYTNSGVAVTFAVEETNFEIGEIGSWRVDLYNGDTLVDSVNSESMIESMLVSWDENKCSVQICCENGQLGVYKLDNGEYTAKLTVTDPAGNSSENDSNKGDNTSKVLVLDNDTPDVTIRYTNVDGSELGFIQKLILKIKYNIAAKDAACVVVEARDDISPIVGITLTDDAGDVAYAESKPNYDGSKTVSATFIVNAQYMDQLTATATDAAGNTKTVAPDVDNSGDSNNTNNTNILLDTVAPEISALTVPDAIPCNEDIEFTFTVTDPDDGEGDYSGIGEVTYAVYVDEDKKAGGVLYSHANGEHYQELNSNTETYPMSFTLPASYNSNNVYVVINAKDNAGNPAKEMESKTFRLDETAPDVSVVFEGTPGAYGYFKDREATVTVKDHSFIEDGVVMDTNGNIGNWSGVDTDNDGYKDVWTCIVDFNSVDGEYHFGIDVTDEAGNKTTDDEVTYTYEEGQDSTKKFVVDDTAPVLSVGDYVVTNLANTIGNELMDGVYYTNDSIRLTFTVDDQFFYVEEGAKVHGSTEGFGSFHITLLKNGTVMEDITNHGVWDINATGRKCTVELKYNKAFNADALTEGDYTLKLSVVDQAGNVSDSNEMEDGAQPLESSVMVLDQTNPNVYIFDIAYGDDLTVFEKYLFSIKYQIAASDIAKVTIRAEDANSPIIGMTLADANGKRTANEEELETSKDDAGKFTGYQVYIIDAQYMDQLTLTATDASGNTGRCEHDTANAGDTNILLDTVDPTITFNNPDYETVHSGYVNGQYVDGYTYPVSLTVTDPAVDDVFSGLDTVYYEVRVYNHTSKSSYSVSNSDTFTVYKDGDSYTNTGTFTVNLAPSLNSNIVTVYIKATDNAGNYAEAETNFFKLDNTTPSVTVDYDNDSAQNDTYFMDTRTATITVVDNNFTADGVSITTEGSVGEWSSGSDSNGDGVLDTYVCYVSYTVDNDYTISMSVVDEGNNTTFNSFVNYTGTAPEEFTLDQTDPTFEITMGNADVDVSSGGYSNQDVTVTLTVDEHNFDESAATAGLTVIYEGEDISQAIRNSLVWSSNGDVRTATFTLTDDGEYKINLSFLDLAGNSTAAAEDIVVHVDQTNAEVYVTGVADKSANAQDEIIPVVTIWDKYYNLEGVVITLINGEGEDVTEQYLDMETGLSDIAYDEERDLYYQTFTFKNLDEDHVYHLEVRHTDLAGNVNTVMTVLNGKGEEEVLDLEEGVMRFSVNRNGSTYSASEETLAILGQYVQSAKNVRILEINVDELDPESIYITLTHDNVTRDLVYGEDYTYQTPPEQNDASWNVYEYVLEDSLFEEDGVYTITIYSVDAAGNVAQNNTEEKDFEITFVVDKTPPIFVALNLEAGEIYNEEQHEVTINCSDNIALDTVHVYRLDSTAEKDEDGNYIWFREKANGEIEMLCEEVELTAVEGSNGDYTFVIYEGDSAATSEQSVLVVCTDKAGNQNLEQEILDFTVSSSFWIRFYANKPLFYGSIGGISALLIVAAIVFLRKKKEEN